MIITHQQDLDGSQDVHGSGKSGAQVETEAHRPPELWTQRATDHEVRAPGWRTEGQKRKRAGGRTSGLKRWK